MARNQKTKQARGKCGKNDSPSKPQRGTRAIVGLEFGVSVAVIKATDLDRLRASDDFIDLVRATRLSNFLNYAFDQVSKEDDQSSSAGRLAYTRTRLNLGAYLHEGALLLEKLKGRHLGKGYFARARKTLEELTAREKEVLKLVRNKAAFHLDKDDFSTRIAMTNIVSQDWEFLVADSPMRKDQYYVFADAVDLNYIIDDLKKFAGGPDRSLFPDEKTYEAAILEEIFDVLIRLGPKMASATSNMTRELAKRLGLIK